MAFPKANTAFKPIPKAPALADVRDSVGLPPGKKASVLNLVKAAPNSAKKRRPKPGQAVSPTYSY